MSKGLASFAVGFGGGYLNAQRQGALDKERQADRAMRQQEFDARMGEVNDAKSLRMSLADAARPVTVESGAGGMIRPETMDNRDVGLPENASQPNNGLSLSQYRVKDKSFETQAPADAYAATQNAPDARRARQVAAYDAAGKPAEAMSLANSAATQKATEMAQADKAWQRKISGAMMGGPDAMAEMISKSEFGPMAGKTVKAVPSEDGKSVTYNMVNADGTLTPSKMTFSNDQNGMIQAGYMLDRAVTPEHRYANYAAERKAAAQQERDARRDSVTETHYNNQDRAALARANRPVGEGASGGAKIQSSRVDADGFMVGVFRDGSARRLTDQDGKPIRADSAEKRVDSLAKTLKEKSREYRRMPDDEVRKAAKSILFGGGDEASDQQSPVATPAPGLGSARPSTSSRALAPAAQSARDSDQRFILENEMRAAQRRLSTGDARAPGDIDALGREISRLPGAKSAPSAQGLASARPAAPAKAGYSHLWQ